jgi:hypothetical protein
MAGKEITKISVSNFAVSIVGLKQVIEEMAQTYSDKTDEEVASAMLERLQKDNYIPNKAKAGYGVAFVREFRKHLGQPYTDDAPRGLDIKVLGAGCEQCRALTRTIMVVLTEIGLPAGVDHVTDIKEIALYGVMGSPALLINGKVMAVGSVPHRDKIKKWLISAGLRPSEKS